MEAVTKDIDSNTNHMVQDLCTDYAEFLTPRFDTEAKVLDDSIEELLTKLEEYCGLVDIVRSDTSLCLTRTLPAIYAKTLHMQELFNKVDNLEVFVGMVKSNIATMEALLDQAESEMGASGVQKLLSSIPMPSFFGKKKQPKVERQLSNFTPPEVFRTEFFFQKEKEAEKEPQEEEKS